MRTKNPHFYIAGHAVLDEITDFKKQLKPRSELGGVVYSSLTVKSLGYRPSMITRIGKDIPPKDIEFLSKYASIDFAKYARRSEETTRYKIDTTGRHRNLWLLSMSARLTYDDFAKATNNFRDTGILILNPVADEVSLHLLSRIRRKFKYVFADSQGFVRRFDMRSGLVSSKMISDCSPLSGVFLLKADLEELYSWTGIHDKLRAIRKITEYIDNLLLTSASEPVELYSKQRNALRAIPIQSKVKDTTGAGDIMLAAFAVRYSEIGSLSESLEFATAASSLATQRTGVTKALLSRNGILSNLARVKAA